MTTTYAPISERYRPLIARAVRICNAAGIMDFNGHVSVRDDRTRTTVWVNSRAASRSTLTASDVVPFDIVKGQRIGDVDEPPSEYHIHREIYKLRGDVGAIVHSHPTYVLTLSIRGETIMPSTSGWPKRSATPRRSYCGSTAR
jgi:L-fuculose-phosphate aldolase